MKYILQYFYPHTVWYPCSTLCSCLVSSHCHTLPHSAIHHQNWHKFSSATCGAEGECFNILLKTLFLCFTLIYLVDEQLQDQHNTIKTQTQKYFLLKHIVLCCQCPIIELIWKVLLVEDNLVLRAILLLSDLTLLESLSFGSRLKRSLMKIAQWEVCCVRFPSTGHRDGSFRK